MFDLNLSLLQSEITYDQRAPTHHQNLQSGGII